MLLCIHCLFFFFFDNPPPQDKKLENTWLKLIFTLPLEQELGSSWVS